MIWRETKLSTDSSIALGNWHCPIHATAPDLLQALEGLTLYGPVILQNLAKVPESPGMKIHRQAVQGFLNTAQTAITKAKNTTPNP